MTIEEKIEKGNKIYHWLSRIHSGTKFEIDKHYQGEEKEYFIQIVKEYIDIHEEGKQISFSGDYKYVKKY